jgi:predicted glycoside hydrolase/deacetylase ChbG (UPF0249 family)
MARQHRYDIQRRNINSSAPAAFVIAIGVLAFILVLAPARVRTEDTEAPSRLLIRCDDMGMCHTVNMAVRKIIASGLPISTSVMFACPWYQEAVEILKDHGEVSIGAHLTLNSEWGSYRWGPVLGRNVPSLVDANGHFFASEIEFAAHPVDLGEVRMELRAQIDRALTAGLRIDYLDAHMQTAFSTNELRAVVEELAEEYGLGISPYFGERSASLWDVPPEKKLSALLQFVDSAGPGLNMVVVHPGLDTPEMRALIDMNYLQDPYRVSRHRQAEVDAITSPAFRQAVTKKGLELVTYRDLIRLHGLDIMTRPAEATGYSQTLVEDN